jgi:hypothetical protein
MPYYRASETLTVADMTLSVYLAYEVFRMLRKDRFMFIIQYDDDHNISRVWVPRKDADFDKFRDSFHETVFGAPPDQVEYKMWCERNYMDYPGPTKHEKIKNLRLSSTRKGFIFRTEAERSNCVASPPPPRGEYKYDPFEPRQCIDLSMGEDQRYGNHTLFLFGNDMEIYDDYWDLDHAPGFPDITMDMLKNFYTLSHMDVVRDHFPNRIVGRHEFVVFGKFIILEEPFTRSDYINMASMGPSKIETYKIGFIHSRNAILKLAEQFGTNGCIVSDDQMTYLLTDPKYKEKIMAASPFRMYNYDYCGPDGVRLAFKIHVANKLLNLPEFYDEDYGVYCNYILCMSCDIPTRIKEVLTLLNIVAYMTMPGKAAMRYFYNAFYPRVRSALRRSYDVEYYRFDNRYAVFHDGMLTYTMRNFDLYLTGLTFSVSGEIILGPQLFILVNMGKLAYSNVTVVDDKIVPELHTYDISANMDRKALRVERIGVTDIVPFGVVRPGSQEFEVLQGLAEKHSATELLPVIEECIRRAAQEWEISQEHLPRTSPASPNAGTRKPKQIPRLAEPDEPLPYTLTQKRKDAKLRRSAEREIPNIRLSGRRVDVEMPIVESPAPEVEEHMDEAEPMEDEEQSLELLRRELYLKARSSGKFTSHLNEFVRRIGLRETIRYVLIRGSHLVIHTDGSPITVVIPHK